MVLRVRSFHRRNGLPAGPVPVAVYRRETPGGDSCADDVLAVLQDAGGPLGARKVCAELTRRGRPWGLGTVATTLRRLRARGRVRRAGGRRGYAL